MAIEDFYTTDFTYKIKTEAKVDGRLSITYIEEGTTYKGALFTTGSAEVVVYGSAEFIIAKNLYCAATIGIDFGDIVTILNTDYDVVQVIDTNRIGHHLKIGLATRA